jgi:hypothetical protein
MRITDASRREAFRCVAAREADRVFGTGSGAVERFSASSFL